MPSSAITNSTVAVVSDIGFIIASFGDRVDRTRTAKVRSFESKKLSSPSQFISLIKTVLVANAFFGPTITSRLSASSFMTYSGSQPPIPSPRRCPTV